MDVKKFNATNLKVIINGDDQWAFNEIVAFKDHATNYSTVTINTLIRLSILRENRHLDNHAYLSDLETFEVVQLESDGEIFFTGIVEQIGRFSLSPNTIKDRSIIAVDIRVWLSKKAPADIQFRDIPPIMALNRFIEALNEPRIALGKVSFTNTNNIIAYDTTNKSPYSILKDVIAAQTKSFVYFTSNSKGQVLINFESEFDFLNKVPVELNQNNSDEYLIDDIKLDKSNQDYFNTFRIESENIIYNVATVQSFDISNVLKSVWLSGAFGLLSQKDDSYFYNSLEPVKRQKFILLDKTEATSGKFYHAYYEKGSREIVLNPEWNKENVVITIAYHKKGRYAITLENSREIRKISELSGFKGDVYRYDKYNDYSSAIDLIKYGQRQLDVNALFMNELKISCHKPFLNVGDVVNLNYGLAKIDGRYICMGYEGEFRGHSKVLDITYTLRNSLMSDTILNYYDNQSFRDKPLDWTSKTIYRTADLLASGNWIKLNGSVLKQSASPWSDYIQDISYLPLLYLPHKLVLSEELNEEKAATLMTAKKPKFKKWFRRR